MRGAAKFAAVELSADRLVRVAPDDTGRFCVEDFGAGSGGVTIDAEGNALTGLGFKEAVRLAVRVAYENAAHLEIEFNIFASGKAVCWWAP
ncbi:MAG: hypothetical protein AAF318_12640 [Pseudomonadota bacterium]